jgi:protease I
MTDWGGKVKVDVELSAANSSKYDGLHLPGGVMNPDHLRMDPQAVAFVKVSSPKASPSPPSVMLPGLLSKPMVFVERW